MPYRALYAKCDQLAPPQKQDDKHDDHDDNNCPDSNEHGFSLFLMAGVSLSPLALSRTKQLKPVAAISQSATAVTETGQRLVGWIRERRRAVLAHELESVTADGRQALAPSLSELAGHPVMPPRDGKPPGTGM